jgi:hypothetical protein
LVLIEHKSFAQAYREFKTALDNLVVPHGATLKEMIARIDRTQSAFRELRRALYRAERSARKIKL